ncbi:MAG: hypothetical protein EBR82_68625 [Caulobacteraceae bacterium]|nr:hypothetical protein [Caulobacteraceae bacterium]
MNLAALVESVPDWQTKTPEQLLASLRDPSVLVEDHDLYTWAGVAAVIGDVGASALCDALIAAGKLWAVHQFGGRGLDLSNPEIQQQLYYLDSVGVPGMETLALHVRRQVSKLQQAGIETTVAEVGLVQRKRILEDAAINRLQAYREALSAWDGSGEEPVL